MSYEKEFNERKYFLYWIQVNLSEWFMKIESKRTEKFRWNKSWTTEQVLIHR